MTIDHYVDSIRGEVAAKIPDDDGRAIALAALELLRIFLKDVHRIASAPEDLA